MTRAKNSNNEGSVHQRKSDGRWCAAVTLPFGRRKIAYGYTEKEAIRNAGRCSPTSKRASRHRRAVPPTLPCT
jgi:hypothetical protein